MPEGYIKTQPDPKWWMEQIQSGKAYRKRWAYESEWDKWASYYRGEWKGGVLPVQVFYSMLRALVPRVYFRNPKVSIVPTIPGFLNMAFAQLLQRIDNKLIHNIGLKGEIKDGVPDTFLKGTMVLKLGFGSLFAHSPRAGEAAPVGRRGERFEYHAKVFDKMPWVFRVHPGNFIVPDGLRRLRESRWCAEWMRRPKDDVIRDPRLDVRRDISASNLEGTNSMNGRPVEMVDLIEIHDLKFQKVIVLVPNAQHDAQVALFGDDVLATRRLPYFESIFSPDPDHFWGLPDAQILEPYQLEKNETRTLMMKYRRANIAKLVAKRGAITEQEAAKLVGEDVAAVIFKENDDPIDKLNPADMPGSLIAHDGVLTQDTREAVGFSRNQLGEFQSRRGDTSATEAAEVAAASDIRVDERRDILADMLTELITEMHEIIFQFWDEVDVIEVMGPGGVPVWVQMRPSQLRHGRYQVRVNPDSTGYKTLDKRENKAFAVYEILKANPLIDPIKLTRYLLTEIEGVELDDLMRALPPPQGGGPVGPIDPFQFAGLLQQGVRDVSSGRAQPLAALGG